MKIQNIRILNFKSIKEAIVPVNELAEDCTGCTNVLVGINESGKSSILDAMHRLNFGFNDVKYSKLCKKEAQEKNEDVSITAEMADINQITCRAIIDLHIPCLEGYSKYITITACSKNTWLSSDDSWGTYYSIAIEMDDFFPWHLFVVHNKIDGDKTKKAIGLLKEINGVEESISLTNYKNFITSEQEELSLRFLEAQIEYKISDLLHRETPRIDLWKPKPEYLINEPIDLEEFKEDTSISIPLKNIFYVYGKTNDDEIKNAIEKALGSFDKMAELQDGLSDKISKHIKRIWKEHKINIKVIINGTHCNVFVQDMSNKHKYFGMDQRSDGFKQFVSLILSVSSLNQSKKLKKRIILLDEPDTHLHPSGIRYMRDELLKIGENNFVFLATHSHYMIDINKHERNWVVKKEKNSTQYYVCSPNDLYDDDVLQDAFGISLMRELIPNTVILVEGQDDKRIFDRILTPSEVNFATYAGKGTQLTSYAGILLQEDINLCIVVDDDRAGRAYREDIRKKGCTNVFTLRDLVPGLPQRSTLEDLFDSEFLTGFTKEAGYTLDEYDENRTFLDQLRQQNAELNGNDNKQDLLDFKDAMSIEFANRLTEINKDQYPEKIRLLADEVYQKMLPVQ